MWISKEIVKYLSWNMVSLFFHYSTFKECYFGCPLWNTIWDKMRIYCAQHWFSHYRKKEAIAMTFFDYLYVTTQKLEILMIPFFTTQIMWMHCKVLEEHRPLLRLNNLHFFALCTLLMPCMESLLFFGIHFYYIKGKTLDFFAMWKNPYNFFIQSIFDCSSFWTLCTCQDS